MKAIVLFSALLFASLSAVAAPSITSVSPATGPAAGGTVVTITGTGFATCPICSPPLPPEVFFASTRAASVQLIDSTTLRVTTPPYFPGAAAITVTQFDGTVTASHAFTFTGEMSDAFERILLPIYSPPVFGRFGSEFRTVAYVGTASETPVSIYGFDALCTPINTPPLLDDLFVLTNGIDLPLPADCSSWPARFFFVPKGQAASVVFNDRVLDVTRNAFSHGTEIPVVRSAAFTKVPIVFLAVPIDTRFRNTLRIYSDAPQTVLVRRGGEAAIPVRLQAGATMFEPAYGVFTDFHIPVDGVSSAPERITVEPEEAPGGPASRPIWAFITVTNNDTQQITTITPDR